MSGDHYFSASPRSAERPSTVEFTVAGRALRLSAASGVFSSARLDPGTAVLLRKADLPTPRTRGHLLDLGCGYGPIACALASLAPSVTVHAVDVNVRARELAQANVDALGLVGRILVADPDDVPEQLAFDEIWSNPPIRIGKPALHDLLLRWLPRLAPGGRAWLVVARHLGGDSLAAWLGEQGWVVERHASQQGYRVLRVTRNSGDDGPLDAENA